MEGKQRIEYIDAIKGLAILLVVYGHIELFGLQINNVETFTFNRVCTLLTMPLFFFISGFIFYKRACIENITNFLKKKFMVLIIPATFFLILNIIVFQRDIEFIIFHQFKGGYWFTYTLFEYFVLYTIINYVIQTFNLKKYEDIIFILTSLTIFLFTGHFLYLFNDNISGIFCLLQGKYYIYFIFGCLIKKYFKYFEMIIEQKKFMIPFVQLSFLFTCIYYIKYQQDILGLNTIVPVYIAITGILIIFTFFRKYETSFTQNRIIGKCLQYIGKRTLDGNHSIFRLDTHVP